MNGMSADSIGKAKEEKVNGGWTKKTKFKPTFIRTFVISEQTVPNYRFEYPFLPSIVIVLQTFVPNLLDNQTSILDSDTSYVCGGKYCIKKEVRVSIRL